LHGNSGRKSSLFAGAIATAKFLLAKHYNLVMIAGAAVGYRGLIEVDGRSPVERAAATFVPDLRRPVPGEQWIPAPSSSPRSGSFQDK